MGPSTDSASVAFGCSGREGRLRRRWSVQAHKPSWRMGRSRSPRGPEQTAWRGLASVVGFHQGHAPDTPELASEGGGSPVQPVTVGLVVLCQQVRVCAGDPGKGGVGGVYPPDRGRQRHGARRRRVGRKGQRAREGQEGRPASKGQCERRGAGRVWSGDKGDPAGSERRGQGEGAREQREAGGGAPASRCAGSRREAPLDGGSGSQRSKPRSLSRSRARASSWAFSSSLSFCVA